MVILLCFCGCFSPQPSQHCLACSRFPAGGCLASAVPSGQGWIGICSEGMLRGRVVPSHSPSIQERGGGVGDQGPILTPPLPRTSLSSSLLASSPMKGDSPTSSIRRLVFGPPLTPFLPSPVNPGLPHRPLQQRGCTYTISPVLSIPATGACYAPPASLWRPAATPSTGTLSLHREISV